jgi:hypothetical protein
VDEQRPPRESKSMPRPQTLVLELAKLAPGPSVFAGDLSALHPPDLLNFLHQGRRTGVLLATHGDVERAVVLIEGAVAWAASTSPGERFGEIICRLGILPRATIAAALDEQSRNQPSHRLGELLVEWGLMDAAARARALRHQVIEIFLGLLVLRDGRFNFRAGFDPTRLPSRLALDVEGLLLDGLRRLDEMDHYKTRITSNAIVPARTPSLAPRADSQEFSGEMRHLLELVDGHRTLAELSELASLGEFEATKAAFRLMQAGYLEEQGEEPRAQ